MKHLLKMRVAFLLCLFVSLPIAAETFTSVQEGEFNDAATWGGSGVPTQNDDVIVNHVLALTQEDAAVNVHNLTISQGASLIYTDKSVHIYGDLTVQGSLISTKQQNTNWDKSKFQVDGATTVAAGAELSFVSPGNPWMDECFMFNGNVENGGVMSADRIRVKGDFNNLAGATFMTGAHDATIDGAFVNAGSCTVNNIVTVFGDVTNSGTLAVKKVNFKQKFTNAEGGDVTTTEGWDGRTFNGDILNNGRMYMYGDVHIYANVENNGLFHQYGGGWRGVYFYNDCTVTGSDTLRVSKLNIYQEKTLINRIAGEKGMIFADEINSFYLDNGSMIDNDQAGEATFENEGTLAVRSSAMSQRVQVNIPTNKPNTLIYLDENLNIPVTHRGQVYDTFYNLVLFRNQNNGNCRSHNITAPVTTIGDLRFDMLIPANACQTFEINADLTIGGDLIIAKNAANVRTATEGVTINIGGKLINEYEGDNYPNFAHAGTSTVNFLSDEEEVFLSSNNMRFSKITFEGAGNKSFAVAEGKTVTVNYPEDNVPAINMGENTLTVTGGTLRLEKANSGLKGNFVVDNIYVSQGKLEGSLVVNKEMSIGSNWNAGFDIKGASLTVAGNFVAPNTNKWDQIIVDRNTTLTITGEGTFNEGRLRLVSEGNNDGNVELKKFIVDRDNVSLQNTMTVIEELCMKSGSVSFTSESGSLKYDPAAVLCYEGTAEQTTGAEWSAAVANVKINNAAGVLLNESKTISGVLTLQDGALKQNGNDLKVASVAGEGFGAAKMVDLGGNNFTTPAGNKLMPIGSEGKYAPVTLSNTAVETEGDITLSVSNEAYTDFASENVRLNKQWNVSGTAAFTGDMVFQYDAADVTGDISTGKLEAFYISGDNKTSIGQSTENKITTLYKGAGIYTARFMENYTISVSHGQADKQNAYEGETITLTPEQRNYEELDKWESDDVTVENNSFVMPAKNVTITGIYKSFTPVDTKGWFADFDTQMPDNFASGKEIIDNPAADDVLGAAKVYKMNKGEGKWKNFVMEYQKTAPVSIDGYDILEFYVKGEGIDMDRLYVQYTDDQNVQKEINFFASDFKNPSGWNKIQIPMDGTLKSIRVFSIFPQPETEGAGIYYLANIRAKYSISATDCTASVTAANEGDEVVLTAGEAPEGKEFDKWEITEGVTITDNKFVMPAKKVSVSALFKNVNYTVAVTGGTADKETATMGETVTLTAGEAPEGEEFDKWTSEDVTITDNTFTMPAKNVTVTATYKKINYTVTVTGGTADKETATMGETVTLTAGEAPEGEEFDKWTSEDVTITDNTFTMPAKNVTVTATYKKINYTVTVTGGTADKETATMGETVTLTPDVPEGLKLIEWIVTEGDITIENNTFVMPASNVAIEARYNVGVDGSEIETLTIYPNPASDYIRVTGIENAEYRVISQNGAVVLSGADYNGEPIDVSSLASGNYIFQSGEMTKVFIKK
ncbi:MAG: T9SS type A sorting domain-containing protein [Bacteroidales bacterium]|nr:T9SS type A sorting domain-containing protein [Bacteroidales bacterium]